MIGLRRLESLEQCVLQALSENVPGDLVETGVWRGGASILMKAVLAALEEHERKVWVVDSFQGLPRPDPTRFPADAGPALSDFNAYLGVSLDEVKANFARYGLLNEQVRFIEGWFSESLPNAPIERIAVLRADGDLYESTMDILDNLYGKVSPGGFIIIDDYGALQSCRSAVDDFRAAHGITDAIQTIDWTGVYWRRG